MTELMILVVTCEDDAAERFARALVGDGYGVERATTGPEALAGLRDHRADMAILSDDIADLDSVELLDRVRAVAPKLPVAVLAAAPSVSGAVEVMRRGAYHYAGISIAADELLAVVDKALEAKRDFLREAERRKKHRLVSFEDLGSIDAIDEVMARHGYQKSRLVGILQDIQKELRYLPQDALRHVAERLEIPLPRVYSVATFYKAFSLKPRGRHTVSVCLGTACHVQGGVGILEKLERELGVSPGEMTYDERFSLECVRCVGCCGLAPVFVVDEDFHGKMTQDKVSAVLETYE